MATRPKTRTKSSIQVAVRLPWPIYRQMQQRNKPIARQLVEAISEKLEHLAETDGSANQPSEKQP